jgi:hypothetical protein
VIQTLGSLAANSLALIAYPGLMTMLVFGGAAELGWARLTGNKPAAPDLPRRRPTPVVVTVALCSVLAAVQLAAPFNPVPAEERNVVIAAVALAFTAWAEMALSVDIVAEPGLLLIAQFCWLLAVLGPAVQPESLRPQVLGNVLLPALLPLKLASGFLYLLCMPAMLRLWPIAASGDRRRRPRLNLVRGLCWFSYCGLFTTLFFPPPADDAGGVLRFFAITIAVGAFTLAAGWMLGRRGAPLVRGLYLRVVPAYAGLVLALVIVTSALLR